METANNRKQNSNTSQSVQNGNVTEHNEESNESRLYKIMQYTVIPLIILTTTPNSILIIWDTITKHNGSILTFFSSLDNFMTMYREITICSRFSVIVILGYMIWALTLMCIIPGKKITGPVTMKGNIPVYKNNGFSCYVVTMVAFVLLTCFLKYHGQTPTIVYDRLGEIYATLTFCSFVLCFILYLKGIFLPSSSDSGSSGNFIFDYFWGTELYPRIFGIDIKVFTNCRFGMTCWALLVAICAIKSYELHGLVDSMTVSAGLQLIYFTKFFWWEEGYMRTIDIMMDRAGFYICWGCLCFILGYYGSVSTYLVNKPVHLGNFLSVILFFIGIASLVINYLVDAQKLAVRNNIKSQVWGKPAKFIKAKYRLENGEERESILLTSGWWGLARHFHYLPELTLALCWSLPALFENFLPYCYFCVLCGLLLHRTFRDDQKCKKKYKEYWVEYCKKVPYKIIPGLF